MQPSISYGTWIDSVLSKCSKAKVVIIYKKIYCCMESAGRVYAADSDAVRPSDLDGCEMEMPSCNHHCSRRYPDCFLHEVSPSTLCLLLWWVREKLVGS